MIKLQINFESWNFVFEHAFLSSPPPPPQFTIWEENASERTSRSQNETKSMGTALVCSCIENMLAEKAHSLKRVLLPRGFSRNEKWVHAFTCVWSIVSQCPDSSRNACNSQTISLYFLVLDLSFRNWRNHNYAIFFNLIWVSLNEH